MLLELALIVRLLASLVTVSQYTLRPKLASYLLSIEAPVSIKMVLLATDVAVDLLDVKGETAVTSFSQPEVSRLLSWA